MEDKTKQKIQELVPEIMELKFGCGIEILEPRFASTKNIYSMELEYYKTNPIQIITVCSDPNVYLIKTKIGFDHFSWRDIDKHCKILGRPITLADCLLAMEKVGKYVLVDITGNLFTHDMSDGALVDEGIWDLNKSYNDQSQETKDFIGNILGVK